MSEIQESTNRPKTDWTYCRERTRRSFRQQNAIQGIAFVLNTLGCAYTAQDDYEEAIGLHTECLELQRQLGGKRGIALSLSNLGAALRLRGDLEQAEALYGESLQLFGKVGDTWGLALTLERLARVFLLQQEYHRAATLLGAVASMQEEAKGQGGEPFVQDDYMEMLLTQAHHALGEQKWSQAFDEGRFLSREQALALTRRTPPRP